MRLHTILNELIFNIFPLYCKFLLKFSVVGPIITLKTQSSYKQNWQSLMDILGLQKYD